MGIHDLPEYRDYWSSDTALNVAYVSSKMSPHRYEKLCEYFHCSDPNNADPEDKLNKVRPLLDVVGEHFSEFVKPGCTLSVDEAMIKFDGRLSWKQFMPKKPTKLGMKLWCLCDSVTGYCVKFDMYRGATDARDDLSLTYRTVMSLVQPYLLSYHHLYADNFFSSLEVVEHLHEADIYYCGTIRPNRRYFPQELASKRLARGESCKMMNDRGVIACKWHDKRDVYMVSTNSDGGDTEVNVRRQRQQVTMQVPNVILLYNRNMGGVDHLDQYLFWSVMDISIINSYILHTLVNEPLPQNRRLWSLKRFKTVLVHQLCDGFTSRVYRSCSDEREVKELVTRNLVPGHSLVVFGGRKRACMACRAQGKRRLDGKSPETVYECDTCQVNLCRMGNCFMKLHNKI